MSRLTGPAAHDAAGEGPERSDAQAATGCSHRGPVRLPSLTGLRFVAAGGVVYTHCMVLIDHRLASHPGPELWIGTSSVSLFFVLSGFVLTHSARPQDTAAAFWRRRAAKILPGHVLTWCLVIAALIHTGAATVLSRPAAAADLSSLVLVNTWVPSKLFVSAGNPVSWSLAAEAFFYALLPFLLPRVCRLSRRALLVGAGTAVAAAWAFPVAYDLVVARPGRASFGAYWFLYVFPITRLPEFVLGMLMARLFATHVRLPCPRPLLAASGVIGTIVMSSSHLPQDFMYAAATAAPLSMLVYAVAESDRRGSPSVLRSPLAVFLGEISYAVYLVHLLVLSLAWLWLTGRGWSAPYAVLAALPAALFASWLLYVCVERPCVRRFSVPRVPAAGAS